MNAFNPHHYLASFTNFEHHLDKLSSGGGSAFGGKGFDLTRVVELLDLLGRPQEKLKIIHVAGTKGKGSTCVFLSHMLAAAGFRVGLYTSPHLHSVHERIRVLDKEILSSPKASVGDPGTRFPTDDQRKSPVRGETLGNDRDFPGMITEEQLAQVLNSLRPHIAAMSNRGLILTYFEVLTVAAIYFFSQQDLDWVVLETGLGGRLDATNAVDSQVAVITPISLDHTHLLGKTLPAIAVEKAGIIKSSQQRVVLAPQSLEVMKVLLDRCREFGIPLIVVEMAKHQPLEIFLKGPHQQVNATTALQVIKLLQVWGHAISDEAIKKGLKQTRWPGRFEVLRQDPLVIADGAHNVAAAKALTETLSQEYPGRKVILIFGTSADKDIPALAHAFNGIASKVVLTKSDHARAHSFDEAQSKKLFDGHECAITDSVAEALDLALAKAQKEDIIVVTGSMFVVAQARQIIK